MKKQAVTVTVIFALVSSITFLLLGEGNIALAVPKAKQTDSSGVGHHPVTLCHNGHEITVDIHALPAHEAHGDTIIGSDEPLGDESAVSNANAIDDGNTGTIDQAQGDANDDCQSEESPTQEPESEDTMQEEEPQQEATDTLQQKQGTPEEQAAMEETEEAKTCDGERIELNKAEKLTLDLHNKTRKENGLKLLCIDSTLTKAAREHSKDMIRRGYFGHNSPKGESNGERLKRLGYDWSATGENLAWGSGSFSTAKNRFQAWMRSEGHRLNILSQKYEEVGVGVIKGKSRKGGKEQTFYTVDFGSEKKSRH